MCKNIYKFIHKEAPLQGIKYMTLQLTVQLHQIHKMYEH